MFINLRRKEFLELILTAEIATQYPVINLDHVRAIGIYDDTNGKYFTVNFSFNGGQDIIWKYDSKELRDAKLAEAKKIMNNK